MRIKPGNNWRPIQSCRIRDYRKVDLWLQWGASPLTMGMADSFRLPDCWRVGKQWFHHHPSLAMMVSGKPGEGIQTVDYTDEYDAHTRHASVFIKIRDAEIDARCVTHWMPIPKLQNERRKRN